MKLLMDTHIWYWFAIGDKTLATKTAARINKAAMQGSLYLAAMSTWELAMMESKGRVKLTLPTLQWIEKALTEAPIQIVPLSPEISVESCALTPFHGDPADRIITATARVEDLTLITRDKNILQYAKRHTLKILAG